MFYIYYFNVFFHYSVNWLNLFLKKSIFFKTGRAAAAEMGQLCENMKLFRLLLKINYNNNNKDLIIDLI